MEFSRWKGITWDSAQFQAFEQEAVDDLKSQLADVDMLLVKTLPTKHCVSAVVSNANNTKWIHVVMKDVHENADFEQNISLRRMSSERDWKGDVFHSCAWNELGANIAKYMGDQYDDEV